MMTQYVLTAPLQISARLLPAVRVADGWLSVEAVSWEAHRLQWSIYIDTPAGEIYAGEAELGTVGAKADGDGARQALATLLSFLSAEAEAYQFLDRGNTEPDDGWIFNAATAEWAYCNSDEISIMQCLIEGEEE
jgi:hypothetical protein